MESILFAVFLLLQALSISSSQESCILGFNDSLDLRSCTEVHLDIDFIEINEIIAVSGSSKILLQGLKNRSKVSCLSGTGLKFDHIDSLRIINIEFTNCGILHNISDTSKKIFLKSAIFIYNSRNVTIQNTLVKDSDGSGLVLMNNHRVNIEHSSFIGGSIKTNYSDFDDVSISGGGGIFIAFTCLVTIKSINLNSNYCENSKVLIKYSHFIDNNSENLRKYGSTSCIGNVFSGVNEGGGVSIILRDSSMNDVSVLQSELKSNKALWGGGFKVVMCRNATNNTINLKHSELKNNSVDDRGGGGIDIGFIGNGVIGNSVNVHSVIFTGNHALYGGGASLFIHLAHNQVENVFTLSNCTWKQNYAHYGAAFYVSPRIKDVIGKNILPRLNLINCSFESNYIYYENITGIVRRMGDGIVMVTGYTLNLAGNVTFANNRGSCIYATSSVVHFSPRTYALFLNNTAWQGAGIALYGFSLIIASEPSRIIFCNNSVSDRGAAIYYYSIDKNAYIRTRTCFIQSSLQSTRKTVYYNFYGNKALKDSTYDNGVMRDDSIYASSLASCLSESNNQLTFYETANFNHYNVCTQNMIPILHTNMSNISYHDYGEPKVSSIEREIEFDDNESTVINFIPGKKFEIPLKVTKYSSLKVNTPFHVSIRNRNNSNITLSKAYRYITGHSLRLKGCPEDNATITLLESGFRKYSISFRVYALHCPPLYRLENGECVCRSTVDLIFVEFHKCNNSNYHASIRLGYWIDYTHAKNLTSNTCTERSFALLTSYCPLGYCSRGVDEDNYIELPNDTFSISICNFRKEQLCGKCEDGRAVFFHSESFKCGKTDLCHLGLLFYLLSEILPITLLFLFIIFFNISFTSGDLNGFIFFAQVYDTISNVGGSFITHSDSYSKISVAIRLIYKLFNFDFFNTDELSFCLWNTPSTLDILVFKYVTVIYALVLVLGTIWLIGFCSKFKCLKFRRPKYSVIQGLSAFLVMAYSQCSYISFSILYQITIYNESTVYKQVVFLQGNIEYMTKAHLPYAIPAIFCICSFIAVLPLLLITYPLCNKVILFLGIEENCIIKFISRLIPITKIKPFLDCFQGTFKDKYRFFAGLYFMYRVSVLSSRLITEVMLIYVMIELQLIVMMALHTITWPYQKRIHNIIDFLVLTNLAIINTLKSLNFFYAENGKRSGSKSRIIHWIQLFFICLPLFCLVLWCFLYAAHKFKIVSRIKKKMGSISRTERDGHYSDDEDNEDFYDRDRTLSSDSYRLVKGRQLENLVT